MAIKKDLLVAQTVLRHKVSLPEMIFKNPNVVFGHI